MGRKFFRSLILVVCLLTGLLAGPILSDYPEAAMIGVGVGGVIFLLIFQLERTILRTPPFVLLGGSAGLLLSLIVSQVFRSVFELGSSQIPLTAGVTVLLAYVGSHIGARAVRVMRVGQAATGMAASTKPKILDTSAIIDGRIAEMVELGFVGGPLIVPQFVLNEVQGIADSSDSLKRSRGRRGLGILEKLQAIDGLELRMVDEDFPRVKAVDGKIVAMAKVKGATVVTTDFNLSKVAELQGVRVLNVHQLSQVLRPVFLPGEQVRLTVQKTGKEPGQGVGYLEDGTMVVVDGGETKMDQLVDAVVTSVLQTSAGRMIFATMDAPGDIVEMKPRRRVWRRKA